MSRVSDLLAGIPPGGSGYLQPASESDAHGALFEGPERDEIQNAAGYRIVEEHTAWRGTKHWIVRIQVRRDSAD